MALFDSFYADVVQLVRIHKMWKVTNNSEYIRVHYTGFQIPGIIIDWLIRLKDCQAWFVNDNNLCRKRSLNDIADVTELTSYLRYDAIYKMISKVCLSSVTDQN